MCGRWFLVFVWTMLGITWVFIVGAWLNLLKDWRLRRRTETKWWDRQRGD